MHAGGIRDTETFAIVGSVMVRSYCMSGNNSVTNTTWSLIPNPFLCTSTTGKPVHFQCVVVVVVVGGGGATCRIEPLCD